VQLGALCAPVQKRQLEIVSEFAGRVGLAFQVIDDVLDVTQSTKILGKPAGSDLHARKSTFPALMGVASARDFADQLLREALSFLKQTNPQTGPLAELALLAVRREH